MAEVLARSLTARATTRPWCTPGQEALDLLNTLPLDAMFLDVSMPGMNGLDVMAEVKRLKPALAVVVITGHATADEVERVKAARRGRRHPEALGAHALPPGDRAAG